MRNIKIRHLTAAAIAALIGTVGFAANDAHAQKIICWKDKSGKVIGCGDTVPPEYQEGATKELDKRGVTRGTTESAEEAAKRRALEQETAKQKAEEQKKLSEQRRRDSALLNTYSNEKEIDQKRDRELQQVDMQISQLQLSLKNATDRYNDAKARSDAAQKDTRLSYPALLQDEVTKVGAEMQRIEQTIAGKEKEKEELRQRFAEQKKRFLELKGGDTAPAAKPAPTAAAAPAAPAKK